MANSSWITDGSSSEWALVGEWIPVDDDDTWVAVDDTSNMFFYKRVAENVIIWKSLIDQRLEKGSRLMEVVHD